MMLETKRRHSRQRLETTTTYKATFLSLVSIVIGAHESPRLPGSLCDHSSLIEYHPDKETPMLDGTRSGPLLDPRRSC
jgi:hypothetical protein